MINPNWARWVRASCRVHFDSKKSGQFLYFDGMNRDDLQNRTVFAEFRIDGPHITPQHGQHRLDVAINILIQSKIDEKDLDAMVRIAGVFQAAYTDSINIFKFGNGPDDDRTVLLGCLEALDKVRFNNFGMVDETLKLEQGTIEGRYRLYL